MTATLSKTSPPGETMRRRRPSLKMRSIRATPVNIPLRAPYRFSFGSTGSLTKTIIDPIGGG
jgi:hypothetical protein